MVFTFLAALGAVGLLSTCFLSASILPFPSDPFIIAAAAVLGPLPTFAIAIVGGMGGALLNYFIGLKCIHRLVARNVEQEERAQAWFARWGPAILIAAPWIPVAGDLTMIVAGSLEMNKLHFLLATAVGKSIKTAALVFLGISIMQMFGL